MALNTKTDEINKAASLPRACIRYSYLDNPNIQKLLDVVSEIIANEYIEIAKKNRDVFEIASAPTAPRNDDKGGKE